MQADHRLGRGPNLAIAAIAFAAAVVAACNAPGAPASTEAMMEHSPAPTEAMMEHSPAPTEAMMEHSPAPS